jgi:hypothetical protein
MRTKIAMKQHIFEDASKKPNCKGGFIRVQSVTKKPIARIAGLSAAVTLVLQIILCTIWLDGWHAASN